MNTLISLCFSNQDEPYVKAQICHKLFLWARHLVLHDALINCAFLGNVVLINIAGSLEEKRSVYAKCMYDYDV